MSSGYKINHAKDNAANYSISTNMTTKIGAYSVAQDNAAMGLDMVTTASENLSLIEDKLTRLRSLATQAQNGTYGTQSLNAMQEEANALIDEIDRLYSTAKFNGISLFNQKEYDLPDNMPKADPVTGFIENPYDYSEEDLANITSISKVTDSFTESTYKIETVEDLVKLAELTNNGVDTRGKTFILAKDLDLKDYCEANMATGGWTPIGTETNPFKGIFNGNGNIISNLTIDRPSSNYQGLFGYNDRAQIKNLGCLYTNIIGNDKVGCLIGYAKITKITNCFVEGAIIGHNFVAGIVGNNETGTIEKTFVKGNIKGSSKYIAGIAGYCSDVMECFIEGNVEGKNYVGGIVASSTGDTENCYSIAKVKGSNKTGGIIGAQNAASGIHEIVNCFVFNNVEASDKTLYGILVGAVGITRNDLDFGSLIVKNCGTTLRKESLIGPAYNYQSEFVYNDYDKTAWIDGIKQFSIIDISTNLQVGIKGENNSQINFNSNFEYNLGRIKRDGIDSDLALSLIDEFTNLLSEKQTQLGATQNRLESALNEISTQYDNLVSSRSTLRDADMAELSSTYIQQQILQEASATLMATANQMPAIALQLI